MWYWLNGYKKYCSSKCCAKNSITKNKKRTT